MKEGAFFKCAAIETGPEMSSVNAGSTAVSVRREGDETDITTINTATIEGEESRGASCVESINVGGSSHDIATQLESKTEMVVIRSWNTELRRQE